MCIFHIVGDEASKTLLTSSVPQLDTIMLSVSSDIFYVEVDTDCGLGYGKRYIKALLELFLDILFYNGRLAD